MVTSRLLFLLVFLLSGFSAYGQSERKRAFGAITVLQKTYNNWSLSGSGGGGYIPLDSFQEVAIDIRTWKIFSLDFFYGKNASHSISNAGVGFRVDLPGYFIFDGREVDLTRARRMRYINTSFHADFSVMTAAEYFAGLGYNSRIGASRAGFSIDTFFSRTFPVFLSLDLSFNSIAGFHYTTLAAGIGLEL